MWRVRTQNTKLTAGWQEIYKYLNYEEKGNFLSIFTKRSNVQRKTWNHISSIQPILIWRAPNANTRLFYVWKIKSLIFIRHYQYIVAHVGVDCDKANISSVISSINYHLNDVPLLFKKFVLQRIMAQKSLDGFRPVLGTEDLLMK